MSIGDDDRHQLQSLEESLWRAEARFDRDYLERILAPDFIEFGRSGRIYSRREIIDTPSQPIRARSPLQTFAVRPAGDAVALVTYVNEVTYGEVEYGNRSSLPLRVPGGWQLKFHQGTPVYRS